MFLADAAIDTRFASISNDLIYSAMAVFLLAFLAYACEWTFGGRSRIARQSAALAGKAGSSVADTVAEAERTAADAGKAPTVAVTVTRAGGGTTTLTRTVAAKAGSVDVVTRGDAAPPVDGVGASGGDERADRLGRIAVSLTTLAVLLDLGAVIARGISAHRPPWGNLYEFTCAMTVVAGLLFVGLLAARKNVRWMGLPLTFGALVGLGIAVTEFYTASEQLVPALHSYWLWIHVSGAMICGGALYAGGIAAVLFFVKDVHESRKAQDPAKAVGWWADVMDRLPAAATLDKWSYRINAFVFPLWTFTIIAGAIWAEAAWGHYWEWDPTETWAFITWVAYACYLHARATAGWKGRKAAVLVFVAFACYLFNAYGVSIFINGKHSYAGV
ncbi:cytochrome c-type biogenesis protein CcsB [Streptacidiphilus sp. BW17]|uniref:c-type cytochrome biogenesis protein CcsB n=1 Tax=Streptacidiphilus sp. BW17 TaxID=3156274 RepID=UPI0035110E8B